MKKKAEAQRKKDAEIGQLSLFDFKYVSYEAKK